MEEKVLEVLRKVKYPGYNRDIVSFGMVKSINYRDGRLEIEIEVVTKDQEIAKKIQESVTNAIYQELRNEVKELELKVNLAKGEPTKGKEAENPFLGQSAIPGVKFLIAVASGKGGVGKTFVAVNLAAAWLKKGFKVGIMDSDVYGPNVPIMLGLSGARPRATEDKKIIPIEKDGMKVISMGFFVEEGVPIIWRGPLVNKLLEQFINDVIWGELDFLIVDMPPGTGDVQLTMAQKSKLNGAIMVTTPQDVALSDVLRGEEMFKKVNVPVIGVIENMSYFVCPHCGQRTDIFSHGGAQKLVEAASIDFLGELPLDPTLREFSDKGKPIVMVDPEHPVSKTFFEIADKVYKKMAL